MDWTSLEKVQTQNNLQQGCQRDHENISHWGCLIRREICPMRGLQKKIYSSRLDCTCAIKTAGHSQENNFQPLAGSVKTEFVIKDNKKRVIWEWNWLCLLQRERRFKVSWLFEGSLPYFGEGFLEVDFLQREGWYFEHQNYILGVDSQSVQRRFGKDPQKVIEVIGELLWGSPLHEGELYSSFPGH